MVSIHVVHSWIVQGYLIELFLNDPICNWSTGMRVKSEILIHIDMAKAMGAGIKFYRSSNNVILTSGNEEGFLLKEYFSLVERRDGEPVDNSWRTD